MSDKQLPTVGVILILAGVFAVCGAIFDWDFFMESARARFVAALFGRTGTRIFYGLLGALLVAAGIAMLVARI